MNNLLPHLSRGVLQVATIALGIYVGMVLFHEFGPWGESLLNGDGTDTSNVAY